MRNARDACSSASLTTLFLRSELQLHSLVQSDASFATNMHNAANAQVEKY